MWLVYKKLSGKGILLSIDLKEKLMDVRRYGDIIMYIKLVVGTTVGTLICVYAPHICLGDGQATVLWGCLDDLIRSILVNQFIFVGGDLIGHIGAQVDDYQGTHGGFGYGVRNEHGLTLLKFARAHALVIMNSYFWKHDDNLLTFKSGGRAT
ncbi:uncharacterized protein LOC141674714 [Apium graveolens]|uniref:uncharacterized protein LOC141674714 n=1 Tax=Apium graveolens TaxID=4045 RepID=UPI003D79B358